MKTITITTMKTGEQKQFEFNSEKEAKSFFYSWCDDHGIDYDLGIYHAGGIGCDYRVELN
jgi:hypothetical protein